MDSRGIPVESGDSNFSLPARMVLAYFYFQLPVIDSTQMGSHPPYIGVPRYLLRQTISELRLAQRNQIHTYFTITSVTQSCGKFCCTKRMNKDICSATAERKGNNFKGLEYLCQKDGLKRGQNLALAVFFVPSSLD